MASDELIKELCARVVSAEGPDLHIAMHDLQAVLTLRINRVRAMAATLLNPTAPPAPPDT